MSIGLKQLTPPIMIPGSHPEDASNSVNHVNQACSEKAFRSKYGGTYAAGSYSTSQATPSAPPPGFQGPSGHPDRSHHQVFTPTSLIGTSDPSSLSQFRSGNAASNAPHARYGMSSVFAPQAQTPFQINEACFNCGVNGHWARYCPQPRRAM